MSKNDLISKDEVLKILDRDPTYTDVRNDRYDTIERVRKLKGREAKPLHEIKKIENGYVIDNLYVLYPIQNAFNSKKSYWLSKKGCTIATYCFSIDKTNEWTLEYQLEHMEGHIKRFKEAIKPKRQ